MWPEQYNRAFWDLSLSENLLKFPEEWYSQRDDGRKRRNGFDWWHNGRTIEPLVNQPEEWVAHSNYDAKETDEVSVVKGDMIDARGSEHEGWAQVTVDRTGNTGLVPNSYISPANSGIGWAQRTKYKTLEKMFSESMPNKLYKIHSIEQVEDRWLWRLYCEKCGDLEIKNKMPLQETYLFHGTGRVSPSEAVQHEVGLDPRFSNGGNFYGSGLYLAERACYVDQEYAYHVPGGNMKQMIIVRAVLGSIFNYGEGIDRALKFPPEKGHSGIRHDSVGGGPHQPTMQGRGGPYDSKIHVVYDTAQVYPAYIVTYARRQSFLDELKERVGKL